MKHNHILSTRKFLQTLILILLAAFLVSALAGCGIFDLILSTKSKLIPMTASGSFDKATWHSYCTFPENSIELGWTVDQGTGSALSEVTGSGQFERTCGEGDLEKIRLYFVGTLDKNGQQYSGTVDLIGSYLYDGAEFSLDKTQNWNARREGDYIYGYVEGHGPFLLKVNPAQGVED